MVGLVVAVDRNHALCYYVNVVVAMVLVYLSIFRQTTVITLVWLRRILQVRLSLPLGVLTPLGVELRVPFSSPRVGSRALHSA